MQRLGMRQLFYLNLGEPFLSPTIGQELPMLRKKNPDCRIVTSTNGVLLNTDAKREAALNFSHIFFLRSRHHATRCPRNTCIAGISQSLRSHEGDGGIPQRARADPADPRMEISTL